MDIRLSQYMSKNHGFPLPLTFVRLISVYLSEGAETTGVFHINYVHQVVSL